MDSSSIATKECDICKECKPVNQFYTLPCPKKHSFCASCLDNEWKTKVDGKCVPTCPKCEPDDQIQFRFDMSDVAEIDVILGKTNEEKFADIRKLDESMYNNFVAQNSVKCYSCKEPEELILCTPRMMTTICDCECPKCHNHTCSKCSEPFHYNMTCDEYKSVVQDYNDWKMHYKVDRAAARYKYYDDKGDYDAKKADFEAEKARIEADNAAYEADERKLANECYLCPQCGRVIYHASGCSMMVCGRDYHATNYKIRSGCGKEFTLDQAKHYEAKIRYKPVSEFTSKMPTLDNMIPHFEGYSCAICEKPICGIRFGCANCPCTYICEDCEYNRIKEHFDGKHVMRLIYDPNQP